MLILLLSGYSQSGKDAVGRILCEQYGFVRAAYADAMKAEFAKEYNVNEQSLHTQEGKSLIISTENGDFSVRQLLIDFAMSKREMYADYWLDLLLENLSKTKTLPQKLVITDFRFPNEYKSLLQKTNVNTVIKTVRINRPMIPSFTCNRTETLLDKHTFDHVIQNDKGLAELAQKVGELIEKL